MTLSLTLNGFFSVKMKQIKFSCGSPSDHFGLVKCKSVGFCCFKNGADKQDINALSNVLPQTVYKLYWVSTPVTANTMLCQIKCAAGHLSLKRISDES